MLRRKPNGFLKFFITQNIFLKFTATAQSRRTLAVTFQHRNMRLTKISFTSSD